ncbi:AarF/ABC1/UbiB kinase family protein [Geomonas nitrogeniifigens]|uniref:AarF/ABC1/UbiB kinase family protein n=1 Tax=Geomonas diazotrophica TaxID=2843197 RepID=A0ABX8JJU5_9BACT|nr:AarF/ABC1/UbiB kinase family protein [Geomonas nitrogeniifigens]QWV97889.1 AarF/ABC1/UbiB kinase family protein [Geomonas nitrogeniifigens]
MPAERPQKHGIEGRASLLDLMPQQEEAARRRLAELVESVAARRPPTTSFSRLWILGSLQAKVTCAYLAYWLRSRWADADERERLKSETHLKAALELLGTMGYLRGAVMKLGQMLATFPDALPDEFARLLPALHFEAPPMHYAMVREVFLDEFGKEPHELFESFEREAFAAASLGQVHRARLRSGELVAVKIQYPGIARTIEADLKNLRLLMQPMRLGEDWDNVVAKLAEVERVLLAETDYLAEARFAQEVGNSFTPEDDIVIPRVYPDYSTRRVLTTEHLEGVHLEEFLAGNPSQELCDRYTHLLTVATLRALYRTRCLLADPNPGNYIFMPDGRLGLVDFGCTRRLTEEEWQFQCEVEEALLRRDEEEMERLIVKSSLYDSAEQMGRERLELIGTVIRWQLEPWLTDGLFDFGDPDFFRRGMDAMVGVTRKGFMRGMPVHIWTTRFILGARGVVYRLKGRCDFQEIYRRESGRNMVAE